MQAAATQFAAAETIVTAVSDSVKAKLTASSTITDLQAAVVPLESAIEQYDTTVTDIAWPPADVGDAHALVAAASGYLGVLNSVSAQTAFSLSGWESQLSAAQQQEFAAANILRHDVGLPPLPTS